MSETEIPRTRRPLRVAYLFAGGRLDRLAAAREGTVPSEFFYGAIELERAGFQIDLHCLDRRGYPKLLAAALDFCGPRRFRPPKTSFQTIFKVMGLCRALNKCDCVVATANEIALAAAICSRLGLLRRPIIGIFCGMLHYPYNPSRIRVTRALLKRTRPVLFGIGEREKLAALFSLPPGDFTVNQFGVDTDFWRPEPGGGEYVLSVGNDARRDYITLLAAAARIERPIRILTSHHPPAELPRNVTWIQGGWHEARISDAELRTLYRQASCVVIPLVESEQPSGQSVALQAMACGKPVVITETEGFWSRDIFKDGENIVFARAGDAADLARQVIALLQNPSAAAKLAARGRETVLAHGRSGGFADRMGDLCEAASSIPRAG